MSIFLTMFLKYWKDLLLVMLVAGACYLGYNHIYQKGYNAATLEYKAQMADYNDKLDHRISNIELNSAALVDASASSAQSLHEQLNDITTLAKKKSMYIVKDNKCTPSTDFVNSYNAIITRANQK